MLRRRGAISAQYFDHGTVEVKRVEERVARLMRHGIANQLYWWWGGMLDGHVRALFHRAGANELVTHGTPRSETPEQPLGVGSFTVEIRWK